MINDVLGKLIADKYRIDSLLRESESGDLYLGVHEVLERPVIVKILSSALAIDARWVRSFVDEARSASAFEHPNILALTDFGTDAKGISYAVFESVEQRTLADVIAAEPALGEVRALDIARQIASAVTAAHAKKVVHGRLDPANVFVTSQDGPDTVKVYGFGASTLQVARDADPRYLSPEQCTPYPAADERSDVYSLGILLYEMLSGVVPFEGASTSDVLAKQNSDPPPPLSAFRKDAHPEIDPIVQSAIAIDPDKRYQTMESFKEDLEILSGRLGKPVKAAAAAGGSSNIWKTAFVVLAGIGVLAAAMIYATSVKSTDPTTVMLQTDAGSLPVQPIGPATGAQEESLAKLPTMTDAEILATAEQLQLPDSMPGGDGFNAWANPGVPPPGAPLQPYIPPGGQIYTIDPNNPSQFMPPQDGTVILVPVPMNTNTDVKPDPAVKPPPANTAAQPPVAPATTPKPLATPPKKEKPPAAQPKEKPAAANPGASGQDSDS